MGNCNGVIGYGYNLKFINLVRERGEISNKQPPMPFKIVREILFQSL